MKSGNDMNIAIIRHSIYNRGSDRIIFDYVDYLIRHGHTVTYYTNEINTDLIYNPAIAFSQIPYKGKAGTLQFILFHSFPEEILIIDLVVSACLAWIKNKRKLIYFAQDFDVVYYQSRVMQYFIAFCYWLGLSRLKLPVISVSHELSQKVSRFHPERIITVLNGVDLNFFFENKNSKYYKQKDKSQIILYFARNEHRKGVDIATSAINQLLKSTPNLNAEVWIIGEFFNPINGIKTVNLGFLKGADLRDALSAADIYLLSSRSEGLSTLLLQAMACSCAVVATAAANILTDGRDGLISPIEDPQSLAANLNRALTDMSLQNKLKQNARSLAEQYSLEKSCREFESALLELTNASRPFPRPS